MVIIPPIKDLPSKQWTYYLLLPYIGGEGCFNELQYCFYFHGAITDIFSSNSDTKYKYTLFPAPESEDSGAEERAAVEDQEAPPQNPTLVTPTLCNALRMNVTRFGYFFERFDSNATMAQIPMTCSFLTSIPANETGESQATVDIRPIEFKVPGPQDRFVNILGFDQVSLTRTSTIVPSAPPSELPPSESEVYANSRYANSVPVPPRPLSRVVDFMMKQSKQDSYFREVMCDMAELAPK